MQAIACRSVEGLLARLFDTTGYLPNVEASCEYLGEVSASTGLIVKHTRRFRSKAILTFLFNFESPGSCAYVVSTARCDNILQRGVPIPRELSSALSATCLEAKLRATVEELTFDHGLVAEGIFLGAPKQFTLTVQASRRPGSVVQLFSTQGTLVVFLCAHACDDEWYAAEPVKNAQGEDLFHASTLLLVDLSCELIGPFTTEAAQMAQNLCDASKQHPSAVSNVICQGALRAWLQRSATQIAKANADDVKDFFNTFPFDWQVSRGWPSRIKVFYLWLWKWRIGNSTRRISACAQTLNNALNKDRDVLLPLELREHLERTRAEEIKWKASSIPEPQNQLEPPELANLREKAAKLMYRGTDAGELLSDLVGKADLDLQAAGTQHTLLCRCAAYGILDNLNYLLDSKASANAADGYGKTALFYAVSNSDEVMMRALLSAGADPMYSSHSGAIPAAYARIYCKTNMLASIRRTLLEYDYLEDDREQSLWERREVKDSGDDRWLRELDDIEMYPLPRQLTSF